MVTETATKEMSRQRSLPPGVCGQVRGGLRLRVDEVFWTKRQQGDVFTELQWWGDTVKYRFHPRDIRGSKNRTYKETLCLDFDVKTNRVLFEAYIKNCEKLEFQVCATDTKEVLGTAVLNDLPRLFIDNKLESYCPIFDRSQIRLGDLRVSLTLNFESEIFSSRSKSREKTVENRPKSASRGEKKIEDDKDRVISDVMVRGNELRKAMTMSVLQDCPVKEIDTLVKRDHSSRTGDIVEMVRSQRAAQLEVKQEAKLIDYLLGKEMSEQDEALALSTLKCISPTRSMLNLAKPRTDLKKVNEMTKEKPSTGHGASSSTRATSKSNFSESTSTEKSSSSHTDNVGNSSGETSIMDHINCYRLTVESVILNQVGLRKVNYGLKPKDPELIRTDFDNSGIFSGVVKVTSHATIVKTAHHERPDVFFSLKCPIVPPGATFTVEYSEPGEKPQQRPLPYKPKHFKFPSTKRHNTEVIFGGKSVHMLRTSGFSWAHLMDHVLTGTIFKVYWRHLNQRVGSLLGGAKVEGAAIFLPQTRHPHHRVHTRLSLPVVTNIGVVAARLNVYVEIGRDNNVFGHDLLGGHDIDSLQLTEEEFNLASTNRQPVRSCHQNNPISKIKPTLVNSGTQCDINECKEESVQTDRGIAPLKQKPKATSRDQLKRLANCHLCIAEPEECSDDRVSKRHGVSKKCSKTAECSKPCDVPWLDFPGPVKRTITKKNDIKIQYPCPLCGGDEPHVGFRIDSTRADTIRDDHLRIKKTPCSICGTDRKNHLKKMKHSHRSQRGVYLTNDGDYYSDCGSDIRESDKEYTTRTMKKDIRYDGHPSDGDRNYLTTHRLENDFRSDLPSCSGLVNHQKRSQAGNHKEGDRDVFYPTTTNKEDKYRYHADSSTDTREHTVTHDITLSVDRVMVLPVFKRGEREDLDCFVSYNFPVVDLGLKKKDKCSTEVMPMCDNVSFNNVFFHTLRISEVKTLAMILNDNVSEPDYSSYASPGVTLKLWARSYDLNAQDKLLATALLPFSKLFAMEMKFQKQTKTKSTVRETVKLPLKLVPSSLTDGHSRNSGEMRVTLTYKNYTDSSIDLDGFRKEISPLESIRSTRCRDDDPVVIPSGNKSGSRSSEDDGACSTHFSHDSNKLKKNTPQFSTYSNDLKMYSTERKSNNTGVDDFNPQRHHDYKLTDCVRNDYKGRSSPEFGMGDRGNQKGNFMSNLDNPTKLEKDNYSSSSGEHCLTPILEASSYTVTNKKISDASGGLLKKDLESLELRYDLRELGGAEDVESQYSFRAEKNFPDNRERREAVIVNDKTLPNVMSRKAEHLSAQKALSECSNSTKEYVHRNGCEEDKCEEYSESRRKRLISIGTCTLDEYNYDNKSTQTSDTLCFGKDGHKAKCNQAINTDHILDVSREMNNDNEKALAEETSLELFKARVEIERAFNLPMVVINRERENVLKPSTYVSFEGYVNGQLRELKTRVVPYDNNPIWDCSWELTLPVKLLYKCDYPLKFVVQEASASELSASCNGLGKCLADVDLTALCAGLPFICGWFSLSNYSRSCGQIKITITPLEDITVHRPKWLKEYSMKRYPGDCSRLSTSSKSSELYLAQGLYNRLPTLVQQDSNLVYSHISEVDLFGNNPLLKRTPLPVPLPQPPAVKSLSKVNNKELDGDKMTTSFLALSLKEKLLELEELTTSLKNKMNEGKGKEIRDKKQKEQTTHCCPTSNEQFEDIIERIGDPQRKSRTRRKETCRMDVEHLDAGSFDPDLLQKLLQISFDQVLPTGNECCGTSEDSLENSCTSHQTTGENHTCPLNQGDCYHPLDEATISQEALNRMLNILASASPCQPTTSRKEPEGGSPELGRISRAAPHNNEEEDDDTGNIKIASEEIDRIVQKFKAHRMNSV